MQQTELIGVVSVIVLGVAAQWAAWRVRVPSILVLLGIGIIAGPLLGYLDPDRLFGDLLTPIVSLSVALILYEGGLSLRIRDLPGVGAQVVALVTVGAAITWVIASLAALVIIGLSPGLSLLLGAIVVVTGPTVIGPLVQHVRPKAPVGAILQWEGIVIDPIGAILAVLVFEALREAGLSDAAQHTIFNILRAILAGGGLGLAGAAAMVIVSSKRLAPDSLINPISVMLVLAAFAGANMIQAESGLLAATVMGVALANQRTIDIRSLVEFKENLRTLLISSLFILLAARVDVEAVREVWLEGFFFALVLIFVARPASVFVALAKSKLTLPQRTLIAATAPRGIVAAAIASIFALEFGHMTEPFPGSEHLASLAFIVIVVTVTFYGLFTPWLAKRLGVSDVNPQGVFIIGAHPLGLAIARALSEIEMKSIIIDTNYSNIAAARLQGFNARTAGALDEHLLERLDLTGIGRLLALTPNHEINALACLRFSEVFGRENVYQLAGASKDHRGRNGLPLHMSGRPLFSDSATFGMLASRVSADQSIKATTITEDFNIDDYRHLNPEALPLFILHAGDKLRILSAVAETTPEAGDIILSLVPTPPGAPTDES